MMARLTEEDSQVVCCLADPLKHLPVHFLNGIIQLHVLWCSEPVQHILLII